ncbi:hypothetical protein CEW89_01805 [Celeribacter ethanolicus]|uniref:Uncharacterized protein n=1 Tax=Celeribacter ethanolicus TaxID=1758178 RepID=A0A291G8A3_9RHOB|nr:hypothetical protein [Celeribacter ethanolicus]ATG46411.1 hypothetical protein CEW89_01805 [Celeribacter ethanolicus]TNE69696.1 MAG: hypothetical protein EP336_01670 [Paracoccaceae bacterium]
MHQREDFYSRLGRVTRAPQDGVHRMGPSQTRNHGRNQHLKEMLARHKAQGVHGAPAIEPNLKLTQVLSYLLAFAMGGLAAVIARWLRFQLSDGMTQVSADLDLALDVLFAIVIAFILREAVSLSAVKRMGAQVAGILLAMVTMHNVVHEMPDVFSRLFSPQWVAHVTDTTEPGTLAFRGHSYHL